MSEKMTSERAIERLLTLIEDAEKHREPDGYLDQVYEDDIAALKFAIKTINDADEMLQIYDALDKSMMDLLAEMRAECVAGE